MTKRNLKIFVSLCLSLTIVLLLNNYFFMTNTPRINKFLLAKLPPRVASFLSSISQKEEVASEEGGSRFNPIAFNNPLPTATPIPTVSFSLTPGEDQQQPSSSLSFPSQSPSGRHVSPTKRPSPTPTKIPYPSKLGINLLSTYSSGAKTIIAAKPKIIKVMDPQNIPGLMTAVKDYKKIYPSGVAIIRVYNGDKKYTLGNDPTASAEDFFASVISPAIQRLGGNMSYFSYLEAPNEFDNTPGWESLENVSWLNGFWLKLIELNKNAGIKTCAASIPVGNPPGSYDEIKNKMEFFSGALTKMKETGSAFCYHAYTLNYSTNTGTENYSSLRYRMLHQIMGEINGSYSSIPFILSEAGVDKEGNPKTSGWQAQGSASKYESWLAWFDKEMNNDNYVMGATLFQIGDGHWSSFNLEPIADWLATYIKR